MLTKKEIDLIADSIISKMVEMGLVQDEFLTTKQAADFLGVMPDYLYKHKEIEYVGHHKNKRYSKNYLRKKMANGLR